MPKPLPIGISDFKEVIDGKYLYVDKTLLVEELIEKKTKVALIPRLRRFGKTLNLSMLRYFFEKAGEDTSYLFKGLKIWVNEKYRVLQGQFPVIFVSLKDIKHTSWDQAFNSLGKLIAAEFRRHQYLLEGNLLTEKEKSDYYKILFEDKDKSLRESSLFLLSEWLHRYHKKRVILLIDEYDTPVHAAFVGKYYNTLIEFLRNWLSAGLKDNMYLEQGVLTGILRIAKESIFSGLNNISTFTILNETFSDKFGLLEAEVKELLADYGLPEKLEDIRNWYNGYHIGLCADIYNPWSVLNCIANKGALAPYWVNTSDNVLMKQLIGRGRGSLKADVEELLKGGTVDKKIEEGIIFPDLEKGSNPIWSLLLYSGYLTLAAPAVYGAPCTLKIPNLEIAELYKSMILDWFDQSIDEDRYHLLLSSLTQGDVETFARIFQDFMISSVSVFDISSEESEKIYHVFVLGLLVGLDSSYNVRSNRESGLGRYDVTLFPKNKNDLGIVMEFKKVDSFEKIGLKSAAQSALKQIEEKNYAQELIDQGVSRILFLGFAFKGKKVLIQHKFSP